MSRKIIVKLIKIKDKEKILKIAKENDTLYRGIGDTNNQEVIHGGTSKKKKKKKKPKNNRVQKTVE